MLTSITIGASANPLIPTLGEGVGMVFGLLILGLILAAVVAVLRSEHTTAAKAAMLLLCFLVPILGAIFALVLAGREPEHLNGPEHLHSSESSHQ